MEIRIRHCSLADIPAISVLHDVVSGLHRNAMPARFRQAPADYPARLVREAFQSSETASILVAEVEGEVLGYARILIKEMPQHPLLHPGRFISVEELAVAPSAQRRGVGRQLMAAAEDLAREKGFTEIELNVWRFNDGAEKFYLDLGYQPTRTYYGKRFE